jgi:hypothetical protein
VLEQIADGELRARASDRIRAIDLLGRYGMRSTPVDLQEVRARLARTAYMITELADADAVETILTALETIWHPKPGLSRLGRPGPRANPGPKRGAR